MKRVLVLSLFAALAWIPGCSQEQPTIAAAPRCGIEPASLDFGTLLPPHNSRLVTPVVRNGAVRNLALDGEPLTGTIEVTLLTETERPPAVRLSPEDFDPALAVAPQSTELFSVMVKVDVDTSPGDYEGVVSFDNGCSEIPFSFTVEGRTEQAPEFASSWGREGNGPGEFVDPRSIAADREGNVYVVDQGADATYKFDPAGNVVRTFRSWTEPEPIDEATHAHDPMGVAVSRDGNVFISDYEPGSLRRRVTMFRSTGKYVKRWGPLRNDASLFDRPEFLDVDASGFVYVVDDAILKVQKFRLIEKRLGYEIPAAWDLADAVSNHIVEVGGIGVSPEGISYVSDEFSDRVLVFSPEGKLTAAWGGPGRGAGEFQDPAGIAVDDAGNVFVADRRNHRIQKLDASGRFLTDWGSQGTRRGLFDRPSDVTVDGSGAVYVLDAGNFRIQKFVPAAS